MLPCIFPGVGHTAEEISREQVWAGSICGTTVLLLSGQSLAVRPAPRGSSGPPPFPLGTGKQENDQKGREEEKRRGSNCQLSLRFVGLSLGGRNGMAAAKANGSGFWRL